MTPGGPIWPAAATAAVCLLVGGWLFTSVRGFARGFVADIVIVVFLVACLAVARAGTTRSRLIGVGAFAIGAELFQGLRLVGPDSHWLLHLTIGSTFDPWDLVAYAFGLGIAAMAERAWG